MPIIVSLKSFSRLGSNQTKVEKRLKTRNNHLSIVDIMITFIMSPLNVSGRDPVVSDPLDSRPQPTAAVKRVLIHLSHPSCFFIHKMIVPHDRLASLWCHNNVAIVTVLHQIELVYFHGVEVSLWRWDEVSSSSWISEYISSYISSSKGKHLPSGRACMLWRCLLASRVAREVLKLFRQMTALIIRKP